MTGICQSSRKGKRDIIELPCLGLVCCIVYFQDCILFRFTAKLSWFLFLLMADKGDSRTCTLWRVAFLIILRRKVLWNGLGICLYLIPVSLSRLLPTRLRPWVRQAGLTKYLRVVHLLDATYATHNSMS